PPLQTISLRVSTLVAHGNNRMTDRRYALRLRCRIVGIYLAAEHASGSPLCAYAIAFSKFCVLGLPYLTSRERSRKQKKDNPEPIFVSSLACPARSSLICLSYLASPSRCVSLCKCDRRRDRNAGARADSAKDLPV